MDAGYKRVFAALDGGDTQRTVLEKAILVASENGAALCCGHVVDAVMSEASAADMSRLADGVRERLENDLEDLLGRAREDERIPSVEVSVAAGGITDTLGNVLIPRFDPDLVVCCKRGLSNLKYAFVGSVSTYLVRNMDCDVLVISKD